MKKQSIFLFVTVLALIGATAAMCIRIRDTRQLGSPGMKMVTTPMYDEKGNIISDETVDLPTAVLNYRGSTNFPITTIEVQSLPADTTYARKVYMAPDNFAMMLNVVLMGTDSRSIHRPELCLPGQGWKIDESEAVTVSITEPVAYGLPVRKITASREIEREGRKQKLRALYVYWFVADDALTSEHSERMWQMGKKLVTTGVMQRWAYVAVMAHCLPGQEDATFARMKDFLGASVPHFQVTTGKSVVTQRALAEGKK